jgi:hypothetical protein
LSQSNQSAPAGSQVSLRGFGSMAFASAAAATLIAPEFLVGGRWFREDR